MKVEVLGEGEPRYAVVCCVHGDEPEGWEAVQKFKRSDYELKEPVKVILANEEAREKGVRFLEKDLNRVFPGDEKGSHEEKLAAEIFEELKGMKVLDLHTTNAEESPFIIISNPGKEEKELAQSTGIEKIIDMSFVEGGLDDELTAVVAEASRKEDSTKKELYDILVNFLSAENVIEADHGTVENKFFEVYSTEAGSNYGFTAKNFELVREGEKFAEKREDVKTASEDFYPVLMSTDGYDDMIGFKARKIDFNLQDSS